MPDINNLKYIDLTAQYINSDGQGGAITIRRLTGGDIDFRSIDGRTFGGREKIYGYDTRLETAHQFGAEVKTPHNSGDAFVSAGAYQTFDEKMRPIRGGYGAEIKASTKDGKNSVAFRYDRGINITPYRTDKGTYLQKEAGDASYAIEVMKTVSRYFDGKASLIQSRVNNALYAQLTARTEDGLFDIVPQKRTSQALMPHYVGLTEAEKIALQRYTSEKQSAIEVKRNLIKAIQEDLKNYRGEKDKKFFENHKADLKKYRLELIEYIAAQREVLSDRVKSSEMLGDQLPEEEKKFTRDLSAEIDSVESDLDFVQHILASIGERFNGSIARSSSAVARAGVIIGGAAALGALVAAGLNGSGATPPPAEAIDTVAPTPGSINEAASISHNGFIVSWSSASDNKTASDNLQYLVYISPQNNIGSVAAAKASGTPIGNYERNILSKSVTGLNASTIYYYTVVVRDFAGNEGIYPTKSVATTEVVDTIAPTPGTTHNPTNITSSSFDLSWDPAVDNITPHARLRYLVYISTQNNSSSASKAKQAGTPIGDFEYGITTKSVYNLNPNTTYYFWLVVLDEKGNQAASATNNTSTIEDVAPDPPPNNAPTAINLSNSSIAENTANNTDVGTLTATDPDVGDTHTFSIVTQSVVGAFKIVGNKLQVADSTKLDFETNPTITADGAHGTFTITDPTAIPNDYGGVIDVRSKAGALTDTSPSANAVAGNTRIFWTNIIN